MEAITKSIFNECSNFTLLPNHLFAKFSSFLWLSTMILPTCLESFLLLKNYEPMFHFFFPCFVLLCFLLKHLLSKPSPIYLIDFSCLKPPNQCRVPSSTFLEHTSLFECYDTESISFMENVLHSSGLSEETCLPPSLLYIPPRIEHPDLIKESHMVLFPTMDDLFAKTKVSPFDIDILILNCSCFCPSPSLTSIIVNKYGMRTDIKSYNVSGMGCSASALCIDMAHNLLRVHKNSNAIVLSTEILSSGWYPGKEKSMLLTNCVSRMGSAAILLSNKREAPKSAKYLLLKTLRTLRAFDDKAYFSAIREEDSDGKLGVKLNKDILPQVARETLGSNISLLGSEILPISEKFWYGVSLVKKRFIFTKSEGIYVCDFKSVMQHFCLPCPRRGLAIEVGKVLKLCEGDIEASLMTFHRFGYQQSSSMWYELAYLEAKEKVQKGDNIWQLGYGSGLKSCSVVLKCIRPIHGESRKGPWGDCIHQYPILAN